VRPFAYQISGDVMVKAGVRRMAATVAVGLIGLVLAQPAAAAALPVCPKVYGHGGYPTNGDPVALDKVRQPNNPKALQEHRSWGADGVEADIQLTRDGTKAVMWHNTTTGKLTGSSEPITALWWASGTNKLSGRRVEVGPYAGETVYTLREWLDAARASTMMAYLEVKGEARQSLLSSDASIKARAWSELLDPIRERYMTQTITMYSNDSRIAAELNTRAQALGISSVLTGRPKWTDSVAWQEPPVAWTNNVDKWVSVLESGPARVFTSYPREYRQWLTGQVGTRCA
jgi:glycerophosphoryl diester phosphodiesterase